MLVVAGLALYWQLWRSGGCVWRKDCASLMLLQLVTGLSECGASWPLLLAVLHSGGAALLVALIVVALHRTSVRS